MNISRLEAFSDGVFAIAFTLLILEFHAPGTSGHLLNYILNLWPSFVAYGISFLLIGLIWANHHSTFTHVARTDRKLMFLNTLYLGCVAFVPFPTELLAHALRERSDLKAATFFYGLVITIGGVLFDAVLLYVTSKKGQRLLRPKAAHHYIMAARRRFIVGPLLYGSATLLALVAPYVSILCYAALIIYFWLPPGGEAEAIEQ